MPAVYTVAPITPDTVDAAFPLAGALTPRLEIERWRAYCDGLDNRQARDAPQRQILVATNPRGHVQGLCLWSRGDHAVHGTILDVPVFIVASAADDAGVASALVDDLCAIAGRMDCAAIRIRSEASPKVLPQVRAPQRREGGGVVLILDPSPLLEVPWGRPQDDSLPVKT